MPVLLSDELIKTCIRMNDRIADRFPGSGLAETCGHLLEVATGADATVAWIKRPNWWIRISAWIVIGLLVVTLFRFWIVLKVSLAGINGAEFFQMIDAVFNSIILLGAAGVFLMMWEVRRKRRKVISAVNKLRCIAHIVDAHQLTKDPQTMAEKSTEHSPERNISEYDLGRYLDYCSEMLSLVSKIAFLYVQDFDDTDANEMVNDLDALTTGLSQKVWQKIVLLKGTAV